VIARRLFGRGFGALLSSQFFGAMNDNVLKQLLVFMVATGIWQGQLGPGGQGWVQVAFAAPFIVLSGWAGWTSDRFCKRRVSVVVRATELPIAIVAGYGFWTRDLAITYVAMVLLTCQSAFFGPPKYGMIPELVDERDLSRANGAINMLTNVAVIAGTVAAGVIADRYDPAPGRVHPAGSPVEAMLLLPAIFMLAVAGLGFLCVLPMPALGSRAPGLAFPVNPLRPVIVAVRDMAKGPLLLVTLAWGWFYLLGGMGLLALPEYADLLSVSKTKVSLLLGVLGLAVGVGCALAGFLSGDRVRPGLVPIGAGGLAVSFTLLGLFSTSGIAASAALVGVAGIFAGFWIIPLQASIQAYAPADERGRFVGVANAISFSYLTIAGVLYALVRPWFGDRPDRVFFVVAGLVVVGFALFGGWWLLRVRPRGGGAA